MDWNRQLCILAYSVILVQCTVTMTVTYIKIKKSAVLYSLTAAHILTILWLVFGMHEVQSHTTEALHSAIKLTLFPMSFISGTWLIFTLLYTGIIKPTNRSIYPLVFLPQLITYLPLHSDRYYHLAVVYKDISQPLFTLWGPFLKFNFNNSYAHLTISFFVLLYHASKTKKEERLKAIALALSPMLPFLISFLNWTQLMPPPGFDPTPISFSIMLAIQSLATFRYSAFDRLYHGAVDVYQNIDESLFIVDDRYRIVDMNNAAEQDFDYYQIRHGTTSIFPYLRRLSEVSLDPASVSSIIAAMRHPKENYQNQLILRDMNNPTKRRYYDFSMKRIDSSTSRNTGYLISFKNQTKQSKALLEREHRRISRDIHDGLSNLVNVVGMNLEYVLTQDMSPQAYQDCVEVAFTTNNQMRFAIRRILDELVPLDIEKNGMLNALESLFKRVTGTSLQIDFTPIGIDDSLNRNLALGLLLYSTCLEGINNAIYNGKASHVNIVITQTPKYVRLVLSDDGIGCSGIIAGRGLEGIEERVRANSGKVLFESEPDNGFSITMEIPFNGGMNND